MVSREDLMNWVNGRNHPADTGAAASQEGSR